MCSCRSCTSSRCRQGFHKTLMPALWYASSHTQRTLLCFPLSFSSSCTRSSHHPVPPDSLLCADHAQALACGLQPSVGPHAAQLLTAASPEQTTTASETSAVKVLYAWSRACGPHEAMASEGVCYEDRRRIIGQDCTIRWHVTANSHAYVQPVLCRAGHPQRVCAHCLRRASSYRCRNPVECAQGDEQLQLTGCS